MPALMIPPANFQIQAPMPYVVSAPRDDNELRQMVATVQQQAASFGEDPSNPARKAFIGKYVSALQDYNRKTPTKLSADLLAHIGQATS